MACFAGFVLNAIRQSGSLERPNHSFQQRALDLLLVATLFEIFYKPAQQGRKVAYLTLASFVFLVLVLTLTLTSSSTHARSEKQAPDSSNSSIEDRSHEVASSWMQPSFQLGGNTRTTGIQS